MFIDDVKINVKAGDGGNGAMTFHREKYVDNGGPDGGDGGKGGSIYFRVASNVNTLLEFRYKKKIVAPSGKNGSGGKCTGVSGEDIYIDVPQGTIVRDLDKNKVMADLSKIGQTYMIAKGGRGGRGNQHFANSIRQSPRFAEMGEPGEEKNLELELKLIADVGLIGFPNVGKSTIISSISAAKPKIANYHFTTLEPMLGVVKSKSGQSFVLADIPGIIEGASEGVGLGIEFLRHVERTRILLHVIDVSGSEGRVPLEDYEKINTELNNFSDKLASKKQVVVANKIDVMEDDSNLQNLIKRCEQDDVEVITVSAATRQGLEELVEKITKYLDAIPKQDLYVIDSEIEEISLDTEDLDNEFYIDIKAGEYYVYGKPIERLMRKVNFTSFESRQYMQRVLKTMGVIDALIKKGVKEGDTIDILGYKLEYEE